MLANQSSWVVGIVTTVVVALVVVFHYEAIQWLNRWHCERHKHYGHRHHTRPLVLMTMFVLLVAHVVEIWLFGMALWLLVRTEGYGTITGYDELNMLDCVYFSAANYTTVGWGDLIAVGDVRFLAGTEALVGFMMITWSASFSYLVMNRAWGDAKE
ncbi:ion channel [Gilvimarinus algae]|uniref:Ion channel n=1 Tax=Gilvimarinus algae TaxID=3058037 RepID=A0ABT8TGT9_9GAMM|nr:ion channel [Gilvimarinus sp. SDUM040014]MDO3383314.1 ion channel [Gilvimarinus sp. SDUM040014]